MGAAEVEGGGNRHAGDSAPDVPWQSTVGIGAWSSGDSKRPESTEGTGPVTAPEAAARCVGVALAERASGEPDAAPAGAAPAPAALPCLQSNNSNIGGVLTGNVWKSAYLLAVTVGKLVREHGLERVGFLTLTFRENIRDHKEAERYFNSLRTGVLVERYAAFIKVKERQARGAWHFHLLVVLRAGDIRTGFDFEAVKLGDYRSAGATLRAEWAFWRVTAQSYGFGRTELLPIRTTAEGIGKYVGKYLQKHMQNRRSEDKGVRLVAYSKGARAGSTRFAWVGVKGWLWRAKYRQFARRLGFDDEDAFRAWAYQEFGPKWAFKLADQIAAEALGEYSEARFAIADGVAVPSGISLDTPISVVRTGDELSHRPAGTLRAETLRDRVHASGAVGLRHPGRIVWLSASVDA